MIHIKWGRDVLHIPIPPPDTPLGRLRADLAEYTHLPVGSFKLVYKGAVMKEDTAPLSTYKLKESSTIALIGGGTGGPENLKPGVTSKAGKAMMTNTKSQTGAPQTEEGAILAIRTELEKVRETLVPDVNAFVRALAGSAQANTGGGSGESGSETMTTTTVDHTRLSELLLQSLLRLDALYVPGVDWPEARVERKAAVREVQGVLDSLDGAWASR